MTFTVLIRPAIRATASFVLATHLPLRAQSSPDVAQQIAELMSQAPSGRAHQRYIHAKGIVCEGSFEASPAASTISRAAHLAGGRVPVVVRFSDGAPDATVSDSSADASPRGMAVRFEGERPTDMELGVITITSVVSDSASAERALAFDPTRLVDGIELSDDPLPALRSRVYVYSVAGRQRR